VGDGDHDQDDEECSVKLRRVLAGRHAATA
jgi:hypothetical protein